MKLEDYRALLSFSRTLSRVSTPEELVAVAVAELRDRTPYQAGWIYLYAEDGRIELLATRGESEHTRRTTLSSVSADDLFVQAVLNSTTPVVVEDARTDPRTDKAIVERLGNRTIVNVPLFLHDERLGAFGVGTFGDQGVHAPTEEELAFISTMSGLIASVLARLRVEEHLRGSQRLESLGLMAGKIAHDFNNILTVVLSRLDLAANAHPDDEHLVEAATATKMAAELSHQLLAYSGRGKLASSRVDLTELLRGMTSLLAASIAPSVSLSIAPSTAPCPVEGDASQLRQVVHNLVLNASDALAARGGTIGIALSQNDEQVQLTVQDDGSGMDDATRSQIFEPFFTTKATGRGLGMAAVLGICKAHSGSIKVDTTPDEGTTIVVTLPRTDLPASPPEAPSHSLSPGRGRVLVVDDDALVLVTMKHLFESHGHVVITANDGPEAVRIFEKAPDSIDLAYVDLTMPLMNGVEVLAELGRIRPGVKAILTSGYTDLDVSKIGDVDLVGIVPKPPNVPEMLALVGRVLRNDGSSAHD